MVYYVGINFIILVLSSEDVLLNGSDRTIISFKTNEECGLVHPIPDNIEQEVQLTEHYRLHSSRLKETLKNKIRSEFLAS
jgi:hypothetical protein